MFTIGSPRLPEHNCADTVFIKKVIAPNRNMHLLRKEAATDLSFLEVGCFVFLLQGTKWSKFRRLLLKVGQMGQF
jgi:hypothetical protein